MNVHAVKERDNQKTISLIFLFFFLLLFISTCFRGNLRAQEQETIAQGDVTVKGVTLDVDPAQLTVPVNTPTSINTVFSMDTELLVRGMVVKGELRGPGFSKPMALTTLPNHPFSIPGLSLKGDYYLENIRLERDGKMLLKAVPESVLIQAIDMVVTRVESRPLTMAEIREKGINITDDNFTVFNFTIGLMLESKEVRFDVPVVYSGAGDPYIPPMQGAINVGALNYKLCNDPKFRDLLTNEEDGDRYLFLWKQPQSAEELIRRRNLYMTCLRYGAALGGMGPDALAATGVVSAKMDKELGTNYSEAVDDYRKHLREKDEEPTSTYHSRNNLLQRPRTPLPKQLNVNN
jgi:hypothetical protein